MSMQSTDTAFNAAALRERVISALSEPCHLESLLYNDDCLDGSRPSSVLLLLG